MNVNCFDLNKRSSDLHNKNYAQIIVVITPSSSYCKWFLKYLAFLNSGNSNVCVEIALKIHSFRFYF